MLKPRKRKLIVPKRRLLKASRAREVEEEYGETFGLNPNLVDERIYAVLSLMRDEASRIDDKETRERWMDALQTFARTGNINALLEQTEWRRKVVDMDQFLFDPFYLGLERGSLYPKIEEALNVIDVGDFNEVILMGAIGIGKTTLANIGLVRDAYKLSCMRSPQTSFGLQSKTFITFTIQSVRFSTAQKAIFQELGSLVNNSPYFSRVFPYDRNIKSEMIFPEQRIRILPVTSSTTGIISMNVIGGFMDEANFMSKISKSKSQFADSETGEFDQARELYQTLVGRRKSRFNRRGKMPGRLYLASSARYPTDFTLVRAKKSEMFGGNDPKIYVYNYSQWEGKPRSGFMEEEFRVQVGNERFRSKVLAPNEVADPGTQILNVPMDFHTEFLDDVDKNIRDLGGVTLLSTNPFISRREKIQEAFDLAAKYNFQSPYSVGETVLLPDSVMVPNVDFLRTDINSPRVAHIDLGWRGDACGIAVGHVTGYKVSIVNTGDIEDQQLTILPVIAIDCMMRVVRPLGGEIDFSAVRKFLITLRKYGLPIKYVTTDGFQSVDTRQILKKQGFITDYQSVESIESSRTMRDCLYDGRLFMPQHEYAAKELRELEITVHNNKEKADHPEKGSKDVVDGIVGVVQFWMTRRSTWSTGAILGKGPGYHFLGDTGKKVQQKTGEVIDMIADPETARRRARNTLRKTVQRRTVERK